MPCELLLTPHADMKTEDTLLPGRVVDQTNGWVRLKILFCTEALPETRQILQRMCQHENIYLPSIEDYRYHAQGVAQGREIYHVLQAPRELVESMLRWTQHYRVMSRVTRIDVRECEDLLQRVAKLDFEGFLVVTM